MQGIDSGACRTSSGMGQSGAIRGSSGSHGSAQDRADALVRATVLSDLGQGSGHGRHSHGIQGVANAVRSALAGQDVTGTDAADGVLSKIETSLHKAAQKLADRGVDAQTIDATIDKFRSQLANALDGASGASSSTGTSSGSASSGSGSSGSGAVGASTSTTTSVSTFVAREVRKERGAIDLVTAEGDHVSIRFRSKEVTTGSVAQSTAADGTSTTASQASLFSRGGVKIEVDGDLNDDELKAIGDLLGKVDDIATKFFSGDVQAAFSAASSIGVDSDQIAAYRLNVTYSRKIAAYGAVAGSLPASSQTQTPTETQTPQPPNASADTSGTPNATGSSDSTAGSTPDSTSASPAASSAASSSTGEASTASDASASTGAEAGNGTAAPSTPDTTPTSSPASAQKTLINFINDALSKLGSVSGRGRVSFSTNWKVNVLITALQSVQPAQPTTASDQAAATNTQLLSNSLQKIAAA